MAWVQPLFWVLILLGIMILIHELGHFWAALSVGIKVETFSIGFGPRLIGFRRGETDFRISAIPFGGYVRMLGEQPGDEPTTDPRSFQAKTRWQRAFVVIAGPAMNILLSLAIMTGIFMTAFNKEVDSTNPVIGNVAPGSPAAQAGIQAGDRIVSVNGRPNPTWEDVVTQEMLNANTPLNVVFERKGVKHTAQVTPKMDAKQGIGIAGWTGDPDVQLGDISHGSPAEAAGLQRGDLLISVNNQAVISPATVQQVVAHSTGHPVDLIVLRQGHVTKFNVTPAPTGDRKLPFRIGVALSRRGEIVRLPFASAAVESVRFNVKNGTMIFQALGSLIERRISARSMSGPIGMAPMASEAAHEGPLSFLLLMAVVSLNLAILNLLPIPILDGGTLLMLAVEMILQRDLSLQVKETVFKLSFVFLMAAVVFVIYNDISKIITNG